MKLLIMFGARWDLQASTALLATPRLDANISMFTSWGSAKYLPVFTVRVQLVSRLVFAN